MISYRRGCNLTWFRTWFHLVPRGPRMRQVYYLQYFGLAPGLVPLGSTWFHDALGILFTALLLGSWLGSTWFRLGPSCARHWARGFAMLSMATIAYGALFQALGRPRQKYPKNAKYFFYQRERRQAQNHAKNVYPANGVIAAPGNIAIQGGLPFSSEQKNAAPMRSDWKANVAAAGLHGEAHFRSL